ncbi:MAG: ribbon-helix-helix protein, CopG family [Dehalococcoidia bacterium]
MSHRTQITLTEAQYERLRGESQRSGRSIAAIVRRAIDEQLGGGRDTGATLADLDASFGTWADRDENGAAYVDRMRRGLARRLADE